MSTNTAAVLLLTLCVAGPAVVSTSQAPVTKAQSISATATIQSIDPATRTVTLRNEQGQTDSYTVGPEVKRFDEFKVGDSVRTTYYASVVLRVAKPGQAPAAATTDAGVARAESGLPAGAAVVQDKTTVTVKAIDPAQSTITVAASDGRTVTRKVGNAKNLEGVKVGDQIEITYTRALLVSLERPAAK